MACASYGYSAAVQIILTLAIPWAAVTRGSDCHTTRKRIGLPSLRRMQPARRRAMRSSPRRWNPSVGTP